MQKSSIEYDLKDDDILYFLHIPKTAGISFYNVVANYFDPKDLRPNKNDPHFNPKTKKAFSRYRFFRGHFGYGIYKSLPKKPVYITILRNPIERVLSQFGQSQSSQYKIEYPKSSSEKSFTEIIKDPKEKLEYSNIQTRFIGSDLDVLSELKKLKNSCVKVNRRRFMETTKPSESDEQLLKNAKQRLADFPFVGITEKFEESMYLLYYIFGWKPMPTIPKLNIGSDRLKPEDLPKETFSSILECTKFDNELYEFGLKIFEKHYNQMISELKEKFKESKLDSNPSRKQMYELLEKNYFLRNEKSNL